MSISLPLLPKSINTFDALVVDHRQPVRRWQLEGLFKGEFSGLHIPNALPNPAHLAAVWKAHELGATAKYTYNYGGAADNLAASGGPSHWEAAYPRGNTPRAWVQYFDEAESWDREQQKVFSACANPEFLIKAPFVAVFGEGNVSRLVHPKFGRPMSPFLIRRGYALPHVDNALWDVPLEVVGHVGAVLVLESDDSTSQRIYRHRPVSPIYEGENLGNYALSVPLGTEYVDVPSPAGSYNLVSAEQVHELVSNSRDKERLTLACHFVLLSSGKVLYYA